MTSYFWGFICFFFTSQGQQVHSDETEKKQREKQGKGKHEKKKKPSMTEPIDQGNQGDEGIQAKDA